MPLHKIFSLRGHRHPVTCITGFDQHVVTGDAEGYVKVWSIVTRRPAAEWRAHEATIITILRVEDFILTHGKDSFARLWRVTGELVYEVPVNTLNFCNVDYQGGLLLTPSSTDSNNFDVYSLFDGEEPKLGRKVHNFGPRGEGDRGHGIIMRLAFVDVNSFYVGYESGHVFGYKLDYSERTIADANIKEKTVINKDPVEVYQNEELSPDPILSFAHAQGSFITGSAGRKLVVNDHVIKTKHAGARVTADSKWIVALFWDGVISVYDHDLNEVLEYSRPSERIGQMDLSDEKKNPTKPNCTSLVSFCPTEGTSYKVRLRNNRVTESTLFVGYNDGLVDGFTITT